MDDVSPFSAEAFAGLGDPILHIFAPELVDAIERAENPKPQGKVLKGAGVIPKHVNPNPLAFQHPSRATLVGATESGKTFFLINMLDQPKVVKKGTAELPKGVKTRKMWANYDVVVWLAPRFSLDQPVIKALKRKMGDQLRMFPVSVGEGLDEKQLNELNDLLDDNSKSNLQTAVVNDDLVAATTDKTTLQFLKELSISGRHRNASLITLTQRAFTAGSRTQRLQQDYWVLFRVGSSEVTQLLRQIFPIAWKRVFSEYQRATSTTKPGPYLMIDLKAARSPKADRRVLQFRVSALSNVVTGLDVGPE